MKDKLNNYVWTTVDVEKKLKMETEKETETETETVNVAREFKRILEQLRHPHRDGPAHPQGHPEPVQPCVPLPQPGHS